MFAGNGKRCTGFLLVAAINDNDRDVFQRTNLKQGLQCIDDRNVARLHVVDAGPVPCIALSPERLKFIIGLEDSIEVTNQQSLFSLPGFASDHVACPVHLGRHFYPLGLKPELIEFTQHHGSDFADAFMVHRAASNIDGFFKQRDSIFGVGIYPLDHASLVSIQLCEGVKRKQQQECCRDRIQ